MRRGGQNLLACALDSVTQITSKLSEDDALLLQQLGKMCGIQYSVDARALYNHIPGSLLFTRMICTFPRVYDSNWSKSQYEHENAVLIRKLLESYLVFLDVGGQIHMLLFKGQFANWNVCSALKSAGLKLHFWSELDERHL